MIVEVNNEKVYTDKVYTEAEVDYALANTSRQLNEAKETLVSLMEQVRSTEQAIAEAEDTLEKFTVAKLELAGMDPEVRHQENFAMPGALGVQGCVGAQAETDEAETLSSDEEMN